MRTRDGKEVDWPYSDAPQTSCTAEPLEALLNGSAAQRAIAHAALSYGAFAALYRSTRGTWEHGKRYRNAGRKLVALGVNADYCEGIGIRALAKACAQSADAKALKRALLERS